MCFTEFCDWLRKYASFENVEVKEKVTAAKLKTIIIEEFGPRCKIFLSDEYYLKDSKQALIEFLSDDDTDKFMYKSVITDCDDFSFRLMGNASFGDLEGTAFGILWSKVPNGVHAVNFYVDDEFNVWVIEPQNDIIFKLPKDWEPILVIV